MGQGLESFGTVRAPGGPGAYGTYDYRAGAGATTITLGGGAWTAGPLYVSSVAAWATAAGASVQIDSGNLVPVPVGAGVHLDIQAGIFCDVTNAHTFTFVGTAAYLVDWLGV